MGPVYKPCGSLSTFDITNIICVAWIPVRERKWGNASFCRYAMRVSYPERSEENENENENGKQRDMWNAV